MQSKMKIPFSASTVLVQERAHFYDVLIFFFLHVYMAFISYKAEELGFLIWKWRHDLTLIYFFFKSKYLEDLSISEHRDPLPSAKLPREAFKNTSDSSPFSLLIAPRIRESKTDTHAHALGRGSFPENIHKMTFKGSENELSRQSLSWGGFPVLAGSQLLDHSFFENASTVFNSGHISHIAPITSKS